MIKKLFIAILLCAATVPASFNQSRAAEPPTVADYVVGVNDGDLVSKGLNLITEKNSYQQHVDALKIHKHVILHCFFGHNEASVGDMPGMKLDMASRMREIARHNPTNLNYQIRANIENAVEAIKTRTDDDSLWTGVYLGGCQSLKLKAGETEDEYLVRLDRELWWIRAAGFDWVGLDATMGRPTDPPELDNPAIYPTQESRDRAVEHAQTVFGLYGAEHRFLYGLVADGFRVGIEPWTFERTGYMHGFDLFILEETFKRYEYPGTGFGGNSGWASGKYKNDPIRHPSKHPLAFCWLTHQRTGVMNSRYAAMHVEAKWAREHGMVPVYKLSYWTPPLSELKAN